ncbi:hypothetical protein LZ30DRAFT_3009 [Colletotrichum cereale]|nr:hypothetical protein LZ30DRAFT_3009 [Colletotrichum cereale]
MSPASRNQQDPPHRDLVILYLCRTFTPVFSRRPTHRPCSRVGNIPAAHQAHTSGKTHHALGRLGQNNAESLARPTPTGLRFVNTQSTIAFHCPLLFVSRPAWLCPVRALVAADFYILAGRDRHCFDQRQHAETGGGPRDQGWRLRYLLRAILSSFFSWMCHCYLPIGLQCWGPA